MTDQRVRHVQRDRGDRYAIFFFGRRVTPWRIRADAIDDAIDLGHAARETRGQVYFVVGAELRRQD